MEMDTQYLDYTSDVDYIVTMDSEVPLRSQKEDATLFNVIMAIIVSTVVLVQIVMRLWRDYFPHSFLLTTFYAICFIPPVLAYVLSWKWFLVWWSIFALFSTIAYIKAKEKNMHRSVPGKIYTYFIRIHSITLVVTAVGLSMYVTGLLGCCLFGSDFSVWLVENGSLLFYYGIYFGLLGRDVAMHITETIALGSGIFQPWDKYLQPLLPTTGRGLSPDTCNLCNNYLLSPDHEPTCMISCKHMFHERCLRGWCMVGKKTTCPICREKVDFQLKDKNPWEIPHSYLQGYHDILHWAVVYLPILILTLHLISYALTNFFAVQLLKT